MRRIADHRLIEIANLDIDLAVGIGQGAQISDMAIAADPDRWPCGTLLLPEVASHS